MDIPETHNLEIFPWNDNFETGIPMVDEQHKQLVHLVNHVAAHIAQGSNKVKLNEVFDELAAYADFHFKEEERVWQSKFKKDSWFVEHKHSHDSFFPRVLELKSEESHLPYEKVLEDVLKFLVNWLVYHIIDNDRRMAKALYFLDAGFSLDEAKKKADQEMSGLMHTFVETVMMMYQDLTSRSLALIKEKNERINTEKALLTSKLEKEAMQRLLLSMEKTIQAMATTIEIRSPFTAGHHRRVAALAQAIAEEMDLPEDTIRSCYLAASIHDLGEIQIPTDILVRPGKLNDIEINIVRQHSQAGYDILKEIDFPWPIAQIIQQHHERLDGSGYPQGLEGDQILLEAKILAVADVVEAMSSHRPFRAAFGLDTALMEIEKQKDVLFDPIVVDACIRLFKEKSFAFPK